MKLLNEQVAQLVSRALAEMGAELPLSELQRNLSRPPKPEMGDLAFGCFPLAKTLRRSPAVIATELAGKISAMTGDGVVSEASAAGPYVNFRADIGKVASNVMNAAIEENYGYSNVGAGQTIMIDFSSPNIAKPFAITHLRSTAIGAAIGRLFRARGFRVVGVNHLGDWGTQFGKLIWAWKQWGDEEEFKTDPIRHLYELYVRFHTEEKANPELSQHGRDWFRRLESGDEAARDVWQRFRSASLKEFERIYERMGVSFEQTWGEAFYEDKLDETVARIEEAGILEESEGALVVRVDEFYANTSPCLIRRSDGASLYTTRDLAAAIYRQEVTGAQRMLYVTGADQADHFKKVFGVLKRMGFDWADACEHVPFGRIHGISTRKGTLIFLEDVFERAVELSLDVMRDRDMSPEERNAVAEHIGIGAVVFFDLSKERIKDAQFNWEAILKISGRTGPGIQYTQVRLKSVLNKYVELYGELPEPTDVPFEQLTDPELISLVYAIGDLEDVIERASEAYEPAILARYVLDLADLFNTFYSSGKKICGEEQSLSAVRITVCRALLQVMLTGMSILGVPAPDRM